MSKAEIANKFFASVDNNQLQNLPSLLAPNFRFEGLTPEPLGPEQTVGFFSSIKQAFPDMHHNSSITGEAGDKLQGTVRVSGTHNGTLEAPGLPPIAATGKRVQLPTEKWEAEVTPEGKLSRIVVTAAPDGGLPGMLNQLGVKH